MCIYINIYEVIFFLISLFFILDKYIIFKNKLMVRMFLIKGSVCLFGFIYI